MRRKEIRESTSPNCLGLGHVDASGAGRSGAAHELDRDATCRIGKGLTNGESGSQDGLGRIRRESVDGDFVVEGRGGRRILSRRQAVRNPVGIPGTSAPVDAETNETIRSRVPGVVDCVGARADGTNAIGGTHPVVLHALRQIDQRRTRIHAHDTGVVAVLSSGTTRVMHAEIVTKLVINHSREVASRKEGRKEDKTRRTIETGLVKTFTNPIVIQQREGSLLAVHPTTPRPQYLHAVAVLGVTNAM